MSTDGETTSGAPEAAPRGGRAANRRTGVFIAVFAASVFLLLTGYRYLVGTRLNDWYLFEVASNTRTALTWIGESAALESTEYMAPVSSQQVRATLGAWAKGEAAPTPEEVKAASDAPLTPWELYTYRIQKSRRDRPDAQVGPRVSFVLKAGPKEKLVAAENALKEALARGDDRVSSNKAALDALRAKVDDARQYLKLQSSLPEAQRDIFYVFSFIVISECGAIEVMAIFFSAVIAFPTSWRKRIIGLIFGLPLMYLLNIVRLTVLAIIGALDKGGAYFEFAHHYLWQSVYIVFVVVVWMSWIEFVVRGREAKS